ncbi:MAG: cation transporter [Dehalococcoidia bacterium]|nr:cation transporter [Dehalococcoidia bacterium]
MFRTAKGAALLSLLANATLVVLKLVVGLAIGSLSILADALDSGMDLLGAFVALFAIRIAARPADRSHPYGHGKVESLSAMLEASLIAVAGLAVSYEAVRRLQRGTEIENIAWGIAAMGISLVINLSVALYLRRVAAASGSPALEAASWHRGSDVLTSLGVLVGLVIMWASPWKFLDPVVALMVAAFVIWTAGRLFARGIRDLVDASIPDVEVAVVQEVLNAHKDAFIEFHNLRTRRSGSNRQIDLHLVMPRTTTVGQAHSLTDRLEGEIESRLPRSITTIHVEACEVPMHICDLECLPGKVPYCWRLPYLSDVHGHVRP